MALDTVAVTKEIWGAKKL